MCQFRAIRLQSPSSVSRSGRFARLAFVVLISVMMGGNDASGAIADTPGFKSSEEMIAMRDGTKLHTLIFTPEGRQGRLPILFLRTPYGIDGRGASLQSGLRELADDGYIFAFQDLRGKFKSEGSFVMTRPPRDRTQARSIDEGTDAYDSIDWLIKNVRGHNGRVGMLGVSYDGWLTVMALNEPHPALKAASPQASPADMFLGDDFHHNGAFRLSYGFEYAAMMEAGKDVKQFTFDQHDTFEWFLDLGPLSTANKRAIFTARSRRGTISSAIPATIRSGKSRPSTCSSTAPGCRRSTWRAGGIRRIFSARSRSMKRGKRRTQAVSTRSSSDPGTTAAGAGAPAIGSVPSSSISPRPGSFARRSRFRFSPTISRIGLLSWTNRWALSIAMKSPACPSRPGFPK